MMKLSYLRALPAGLALVLSLAAAPVLAQQTPTRPAAPSAAPPAQQRPGQPPPQPIAVQPLPPKGTFMVILDNFAVEREGKAFQSIRVQHDKALAGQQAEITKMENDLRSADQDLSKQRTV